MGMKVLGNKSGSFHALHLPARRENPSASIVGKKRSGDRSISF